MSNYNVGNIFGFSCGECEYNRNCYGGNLGNKFKFCQKSKEKLESFDKLQQENKKYKEVIDKSYIRVMHLLDYYDHYRVLPKSIIEELINLQIDLDILKEVD